MYRLVSASAPHLCFWSGPVTLEQSQRGVCGFFLVGGVWVRERFTDLPWCWRCADAHVSRTADWDGGYSCELHLRCYAFGCLTSDAALLKHCRLRSLWRFCKPYCIDHCWCTDCCCARSEKQ